MCTTDRVCAQRLGSLPLQTRRNDGVKHTHIPSGTNTSRRHICRKPPAGCACYVSPLFWTSSAPVVKVTAQRFVCTWTNRPDLIGMITNTQAYAPSSIPACICPCSTRKNTFLSATSAGAKSQNPPNRPPQAHHHPPAAPGTHRQPRQAAPQGRRGRNATPFPPSSSSSSGSCTRPLPPPPFLFAQPFWALVERATPLSSFIQQGKHPQQKGPGRKRGFARHRSPDHPSFGAIPNAQGPR
jgi:hypothetical protein